MQSLETVILNVIDSHKKHVNMRSKKKVHKARQPTLNATGTFTD